MRWTGHFRHMAVAMLVLTSSSLAHGMHIQKRSSIGNQTALVTPAVPSSAARVNSSSILPPPAGLATGSQAQTAAVVPAGMAQEQQPVMSIDPASGGFPGGSPPNTTVDLPLTILFLLMYIGGAATHISIYKANAKRGHKFLLSDLMFDFCMVRSLTCIFRIAWVFSQMRGVILAAQIFFNGGAAVIFAVNIFLVQRIVRSMHPQIGWSAPFSIITQAMAISVPAIILIQIGSLIGSFFSADVESRLNGFEGVLKFGSSYNLFLVTFPFIAIFMSCSVPGPKPEKFGVGNLRVKTSMVMFASAALTAGAIVRTYAFFNKRPAVNDDVLFGKPVFYTTQFLLEIIVVAMYALLRFDLLFHVPNGSSGPGDYQRERRADEEKAGLLTRDVVEERIAACNVPYQILESSYAKSTAPTAAGQPILAMFFPQVGTAESPVEIKEGELPPRPAAKVSRRQSFMEAIGSRPVRDDASHDSLSSYYVKDILNKLDRSGARRETRLPYESSIGPRLSERQSRPPLPGSRVRASQYGGDVKSNAFQQRRNTAPIGQKSPPEGVSESLADPF